MHQLYRTIPYLHNQLNTQHWGTVEWWLNKWPNIRWNKNLISRKRDIYQYSLTFHSVGVQASPLESGLVIGRHLGQLCLMLLLHLLQLQCKVNKHQKSTYRHSHYKNTGSLYMNNNTRPPQDDMHVHKHQEEGKGEGTLTLTLWEFSAA